MKVFYERFLLCSACPIVRIKVIQLVMRRTRMDKYIKIFIFCIVSLIIVLPLQVKSEKENQHEGSEERLVQNNERKDTGMLIEGPEVELLEQDWQSEEIFEFLKSAFMSQVALSEEGRSMEDVMAILEPYFSVSYIDLFLKENIVEENGQYFTYGSDFALYYLPFFSYSDETKVVYDQKSIFVVEYFPAVTEGPVSYEGHYEAIELDRSGSGLKITDVWYENIPEHVLESAYPNSGQ